MGPITIASIIVVFAVGVGAGAWFTRRQAAKPVTLEPVQPVRDAGPEHMETPPRRWDMVDQQADESFPASDPPGNY